MSENEAMEPATALARAQELDATVRSGSRWYVRYQLIYAGAAAVAVFSLGLLNSPSGVAIVTACWMSVIAALIVYAIRQPVTRRGFGRRHTIMILAWALLYQAVLFPGVFWFQGDLTWWLPGAVVVALPGLVGAYLEARR
jgi:hypothetical protein